MKGMVLRPWWHQCRQPRRVGAPSMRHQRADQGIVGARALSRSHAGTMPLAYLGAPHPVFYAGIDEQKAPPGRRVPSPALWRPMSWSRPSHPPCARPRGALPGTVARGMCRLSALVPPWSQDHDLRWGPVGRACRPTDRSSRSARHIGMSIMGRPCHGGSCAVVSCWDSFFSRFQFLTG